MSEVRMKQKPFFIGSGLILLLLFYLMLRDCEKRVEEVTEPQINSKQTNIPLPFTVYAITPTYARAVQKAEITRLAQTIMLLPYVHWIIVEDAEKTSSLVQNVLNRTNLQNRSTLLSAKTPTDYKLKKKDPSWMKPRGVEQRNKGLEWIRANVKYSKRMRSVIYFMDDDNTYSIELFEEMKKIDEGKVGVWPVGLVGGLLVEKPVLDDNNLVMGFNSAWRPERPFPLDMAGFAISTDLILNNPEAVFSFEIERGYQESEILRYLVVVRDLQPMANFCRDIFVWHTRTESPKLDAEYKLRKEGQSSNAGMEV